jgi:hypothetical protein
MSKWIKIEDQEPTEKEINDCIHILVTNGKYIATANWDGYSFDSIDWLNVPNDKFMDSLYFEITHWMLLPKPPKK